MCRGGIYDTTRVLHRQGIELGRAGRRQRERARQSFAREEQRGQRPSWAATGPCVPGPARACEHAGGRSGWIWAESRIGTVLDGGVQPPELLRASPAGARARRASRYAERRNPGANDVMALLARQRRRERRPEQSPRRDEPGASDVGRNGRGHIRDSARLLQSAYRGTASNCRTKSDPLSHSARALDVASCPPVRNAHSHTTATCASFLTAAGEPSDFGTKTQDRRIRGRPARRRPAFRRPRRRPPPTSTRFVEQAAPRGRAPCACSRPRIHDSRPRHGPTPPLSGR